MVHRWERRQKEKKMLCICVNTHIASKLTYVSYIIAPARSASHTIGSADADTVFFILSYESKRFKEVQQSINSGPSTLTPLLLTH